MTIDTLTAAEQALDEHIKSNNSIQRVGEGLRRQLWIQTIVLATVGTVLAIETTTLAVLRIRYGL